MAEKTRVAIIYDGSNFYYKLKDLRLHRLLSFDFTGFNQFLVKKQSLVSAAYYIGAIKRGRDKKSQRLHANQQRLFALLKKHGVRYSLGYLLKSDGAYHEKGVDVNMAVDILVAAYEDQCDKIILVSSDTDLLPAIEKARALGKEVEYVGFGHMPSLALIANCSFSRLLSREELEPFVS